MRRILDILKPFGDARGRAAGKRRSRAQQPCVKPLEVRALMAASFQGLGANTDATAVSADGSVVVGNAIQGPFYWTQSNGVDFLRDSSGNIYRTGLATGVSGNGSVIVGDIGLLGTGFFGVGAFRWASGVAAPIPQLANGYANSVSTDGAIIAGDVGVPGGWSPYMLTGATLEIIPLPTGDYSNQGLPGSIPFIGTTMSANGAVVAGNQGGEFGGTNLGTWQWKNGSLIQSPGGTGDATAVSPDGSVVVGSTGTNGSGGLTQAFEWTNGVVTPLTWPAGYVTGSATAASTDGATIVGLMSPPGNGGGGGGGGGQPSAAFIWNQASGVQDLEQVLISDGAGSSLAGWTLTAATAITPDGNTIVGNGIDPQGQQEGWIVSLSSPHQQTPTITWANPADIVYGTTFGAAQLDATANVPGTFTYSPPAGTVLHARSGQTLSVTFAPSDTTDYTTATATVSINVLQATPTITWANPADVVYGTTLGAAQLDATASVPGTFTYSPPMGTVLSAGNNQTLSARFTPMDTTDYTGATATATISVLPGPPTSAQVHRTKTVVTAKPRSSNFGRLITLTATVRNLDHAGGVPTGGIVTFLDGKRILGMAPLSLGTASLTTSGLLVGRNSIRGNYGGGEDFRFSNSAPIIVRIRAHGSGPKKGHRSLSWRILETG